MALEAYMNGQKDSAEKNGSTLRFELELTSQTEESTNEFSYAHLVEDALKKCQLQNPSVLSLCDPLAVTPDAKLQAVARRFEEKYGPKKRKRNPHDSDLIDRGYGYDVSDSFVDDTELSRLMTENGENGRETGREYEDYVPPTVDTQFGGFYINTGELEFKPVKDKDVDSDDSEFAFKKKKRPKLKKQPSHCTPQAILASQKLKKAKQHVASHKVPKPIQKALLAGPGSSPLTSKTKPAVKRPKKAKEQPQSGTSGAALAVVGSSSSSVGPPSIPIGVGNISISIPVFDESHSAAATAAADGASEASPLGLQSAVQKLPFSESNPEKPQEAPKPPPVLPSNLPHDLLAKIQQLEEAVVRDHHPDGKVSNKARGTYDKQLVEIELACKTVNIKTRTAVMGYLGPKLGVSRATLFKRIKLMLRKKEAEALEEPLRRLKLAIDASIPEQIAQYEEEVKIWSESRPESSSSLSDKDKMDVDEDTKMEDVFEDPLLPGGSQPEGTNPTKTTTNPCKSKRPPRKKYKWTEETKKLLCDVVRVKVESEETINRISRGNSQEIVELFLDEKVKPLWPKGWMQKSMLYRTSEPAHKHFSNPQPKKAAVLAKDRDKEKLLVVKKEPEATIATKPITAINPKKKSGAQTTLLANYIPTSASATHGSHGLSPKAEPKLSLLVQKTHVPTSTTGTIVVGKPTVTAIPKPTQKPVVQTTATRTAVAKSSSTTAIITQGSSFGKTTVLSVSGSPTSVGRATVGVTTSGGKVPQVTAQQQLKQGFPKAVTAASVVVIPKQSPGQKQASSSGKNAQIGIQVVGTGPKDTTTTTTSAASSPTMLTAEQLSALLMPQLLQSHVTVIPQLPASPSSSSSSAASQTQPSVYLPGQTFVQFVQSSKANSPAVTTSTKPAIFKSQQTSLVDSVVGSKSHQTLTPVVKSTTPVWPQKTKLAGNSRESSPTSTIQKRASPASNKLSAKPTTLSPSKPTVAVSSSLTSSSARTTPPPVRLQAVRTDPKPLSPTVVEYRPLPKANLPAGQNPSLKLTLKKVRPSFGTGMATLNPESPSFAHTVTSPSTSGLKSPVEQIFEEHSYGSYQIPQVSVVQTQANMTPGTSQREKEGTSHPLLLLAGQSGTTVTSSLSSGGMMSSSVAGGMTSSLGVGGGMSSSVAGGMSLVGDRSIQQNQVSFVRTGATPYGIVATTADSSSNTPKPPLQ